MMGSVMQCGTCSLLLLTVFLQATLTSLEVGATYTLFEYVGDSGTPFQSLYSSLQNLPPTSQLSGIALVYAIGFFTDQQSAASHSQLTGAFFPTGSFAIATPSGPELLSVGPGAMNLGAPNPVSFLKQKHPNAKVVASLGGDAATTAWVNPAHVPSYVSTAAASLEQLADNAGLDGFDINYEYFPGAPINVNAVDFADVFCQILEQLKQKHDYFISLTPYSGTDSYYSELYKCLQSNSITVDVVNWQDYSSAASDSEELSIRRSSTGTNGAGSATLAQLYPHAPMLLGLNPVRAADYSCSAILLNIDRIYNVLVPLLQGGTVMGVMIFDADLTSKALLKDNSSNFQNMQAKAALANYLVPFDLEDRVLSVFQALLTQPPKQPTQQPALAVSTSYVPPSPPPPPPCPRLACPVNLLGSPTCPSKC